MAESSRIYTAALIVIGDEILSGRTQDKNIAQVAAWLGVDDSDRSPVAWTYREVHVARNATKFVRIDIAPLSTSEAP